MVRKIARLQYYEAVGKRKSSVARVRLYIVASGKEVAIDGIKMHKGEIYVNKKPIHAYFPGEGAKLAYEMPFQLTGSNERFAVSVHVAGGGVSGQLDAVAHGVSRALEKADKDFRPILRKAGLLTRDARIKERRKVGTGGKARRKKQSPKR